MWVVARATKESRSNVRLFYLILHLKIRQVLPCVSVRVFAVLSVVAAFVENTTEVQQIRQSVAQ